MLQLSLLANEVELRCKEHQQSIQFLDIAPNIPFGQRVKCHLCKIQGRTQILSISQALKLYDENMKSHQQKFVIMGGELDSAIKRVRQSFDIFSLALRQTIYNFRPRREESNFTISELEELAYQLSIDKFSDQNDHLQEWKEQFQLPLYRCYEILSIDLNRFKYIIVETKQFLDQFFDKKSSKKINSLSQNIQAHFQMDNFQNFDFELENTEFFQNCPIHSKPQKFFDQIEKSVTLICEDCCTSQNQYNLEGADIAIKNGKNYHNLLKERTKLQQSRIQQRFFKASAKLQKMQTILLDGLKEIEVVWDNFYPQVDQASEYFYTKNYEEFLKILEPTMDKCKSPINQFIFAEKCYKEYCDRQVQTSNILVDTNEQFDQCYKSFLNFKETIGDLAKSKFFEAQVENAQRGSIILEEEVKQLIFDKTGNYLISQGGKSIQCFSLKTNELQFKLETQSPINAFSISSKFQSFVYAQNNYLEFYIINDQQQKMKLALKRKIQIEDRILQMELDTVQNFLYVFTKWTLKIWSIKDIWKNVYTFELPVNFCGALFNQTHKILTIQKGYTLDSINFYYLPKLNNIKTPIELKIQSIMKSEFKKIEFFHQDDLIKIDYKFLLLCFLNRKIMIHLVDLEKSTLTYLQTLDMLDGRVSYSKFNNYLMISFMKNTCLYLYKLEKNKDADEKLHLRKITCIFPRLGILYSYVSPFGRFLVTIEKLDVGQKKIQIQQKYLQFQFCHAFASILKCTNNVTENEQLQKFNLL